MSVHPFSLDLHAEPAPIVIDLDGIARVGKTRVTLDTVVVAFLDGATSEEIAQQYPTLSYADIYSGVGYYLRHRAEVDEYLQQRQKDADAIRKQNESRHPPHGVRERLLARVTRA